MCLTTQFANEISCGRESSRVYALPSLRCLPILIAGAHTSLLDGFAAHADDLNITEVPTCGHFIVDEQPDLVVKWCWRC
ncbi:hypothetical protein B5P44_27065 [Mycobacterium sp. CBMA 213]|nr:hypothetical protein [Mycolicibacterium sp. CBMA 213]